MNVLIISPHLDDSVWSLGGAMRRWHRRGHRVVSLTVFAGLTTPHASSSWDTTCGFASGHEAALARREEDRRACALVGAEPQWLELHDETHEAQHDPDTVWQTLAPCLDGHDVILVPGWPLRHNDHKWLASLIDERIDPAHVVAGYGEQPYLAMTTSAPRGPQPATVHRRTGTELHWHHHRMSLGEVLAKRRAVVAYRSQLRPQQTDVRRLRRYEATARSEAIAWSPADDALRLELA